MSFPRAVPNFWSEERVDDTPATGGSSGRAPRSRRGARVIVVGGGAAGLAAAADLCRRGFTVTLVEARDRLGGRVDTRSDPVLGIAVERGAEFVHGRPQATLALARRARARLRGIPDRHGRRRGGRLVDAAAELADAQELLRLGRSDDEPFAAVLRRGAARGRSAEVAELARSFVRGFYLADPRAASALALARLTRSLDEIDGDALSRVEGGYSALLAPLADTVRNAGELRLSTVVDELRWRRGAVSVLARGAAGGRLAPIRGVRAIVTVPTAILRDRAVRFVPALPEKRRAAAALAPGPLVKVLLRFRQAPWTDSGPRRLVFLHVPGAPMPVFWTLAPLHAPLLVGWAGGPDAARLAGRPEPEVVRAALASAGRGLGTSPGALEDRLDGAAVVDWTADPFARGGYAVFPVGSGGASEALARPVERTLFFAGEATAAGHAGTVEGALRSGARAAREVAASFGG
ncbi:MAG TPA: NAD(P)/FAD-dependent oxidoreductase [Anaeromyxobacter sp.]